MRWSSGIAFALLWCGGSAGIPQDPAKEKSGAPKEQTEPAQQPNPAGEKERIMAKVKAVLEEARKGLMDRISKFVDEELAKRGAEAPKASPLAERQKELEKKLKELQREVAKVKGELLQVKWFARDEKLYNEARGAQMTPQDALDEFNAAMQDHQDKKFDASVPSFKSLFYAFHDAKNKQIRQLGIVSAYNVACGYSLDGKKEEALDWLEISEQAGFMKVQDQCHETMLEHVEKDADLDNIRKESRYLDFVSRHKP